MSLARAVASNPLPEVFSDAVRARASALRQYGLAASLEFRLMAESQASRTDSDNRSDEQRGE